MARRTASAAAENVELSEREDHARGQAAIADTEMEIFSEAMNAEEPENDGDTSLEEMEDPLEADIDDGDEGDEGDEQAEDSEDAEGEGEEAAAEDEGEVALEDGPVEHADRGVPPGRLREEADRRRQAEGEAAELRAMLATMNARFDGLESRLQPQPQQIQPQPTPQPQTPPHELTQQQIEALGQMPDRWADPEGFDRWQDRRYAMKLENGMRAVREDSQRQLMQSNIMRVDNNLAQAMQGPDGLEFRIAYDRLKSHLDSNPNAPTAQALRTRVLNAADPSAEVFSWWDEQGGREAFDQMLFDNGFVRPPATQQPRVQPRQESRAPVGRRRSVPSLNEARGGFRRESIDPELYNNSEDSVFRFAMEQ